MEERARLKTQLKDLLTANNPTEAASYRDWKDYFSDHLIDWTAESHIRSAFDTLYKDDHLFCRDGRGVPCLYRWVGEEGNLT